MATSLIESLFDSYACSLSPDIQPIYAQRRCLLAGNIIYVAGECPPWHRDQPLLVSTTLTVSSLTVGIKALHLDETVGSSSRTSA
jgi:hypothetical protein